jgi:MarR family transcriptional regulator, organic hydroperoxide resistance regulator
MPASRLTLDSLLCFTVYSAAHAFNRVYKPLLDRLGLTYPQFLAMVVLWQQDGLTVGSIGEKLSLDSGTLTPLLKRLEAAGLIRRERDAQDQRQVRIHLTAEGHALRREAEALPPAIQGACGLEIGEARALQQALEGVRDALNQAADAQGA